MASQLLLTKSSNIGNALCKMTSIDYQCMRWVKVKPLILRHPELMRRFQLGQFQALLRVEETPKGKTTRHWLWRVKDIPHAAWSWTQAVAVRGGYWHDRTHSFPDICGFWILGLVRTNHFKFLPVGKCSQKNFVLLNVKSSTKDTWALNTSGRKKLMLILSFYLTIRFNTRFVIHCYDGFANLKFFCISNPKSVA